MSVRIKFCGMTRTADVQTAVILGVDAIGFNLARGPRRLSREQAGTLARLVPPLICTVALFADASEEDILAGLQATRCSAVQLHGNEPPELAERLRARVPVIKAATLTTPEQLDELARYPADVLLLDSPGGGSGKGWNFDLLAGRACPVPVIVAGGLHPGNVAATIALTHPYGVDVASGIESAPGIKDAALMRQFIAACRNG